MIIQEAIKTGKPFKREKHAYYITCDYASDFMFYDDDEGTFGDYFLTMDDVLATDWENK